MACGRMRRPSTTPTTPSCQKLTAPWPTCAANFPIPRPQSQSARTCSAPFRFAAIPNAPGCCWKIISRNCPCRARTFPATTGGRASWRPRATHGSRRSLSSSCGPNVPCPPNSPLTPIWTVFPRLNKRPGEQQLVRHLETWLFPPKPVHLDSPRASLRVLCRPQPDSTHSAHHHLAVQFHLLRPRTGEKVKTLTEILELTTRAAHEQELFAPTDWEFIQWLAEDPCGAHGRRSDDGVDRWRAAALAHALGASRPA